MRFVLFRTKGATDESICVGALSTCGTKVANITASLGGTPLRSMRKFLNMGAQATHAAAASALADEKVLVALEEVDIRAPIYDP
jgi:hypothetical protein